MRKKQVIRLSWKDDLPEKIKPISEKWTRLANAYGDIGSCVIGAGFEFDFEEKRYFLPPMSMWQGSCSWEASVKEIKADLEAIGCTDVVFHWGIMD